MPWFDVGILALDGTAARPGERGEIVVAGKQAGAVTLGYFRSPEATARALRAGLLHTGDAGSQDGGLFRYHGRLADRVRVKGENVSAWDVEHVAGRHPHVAACAMVGVPAEVGDQDIKLFVQSVAGALLTPEAISAWLEDRLAGFQRPRYVAIVDSLPLTPSQRIAKHALPPGAADAWDRLATPRSGGTTQ